MNPSIDAAYTPRLLQCGFNSFFFRILPPGYVKSFRNSLTRRLFLQAVASPNEPRPEGACYSQSK